MGVRSVVPRIEYLAVGTSAVQLTTITEAENGVYIKSPSANTNTIFVGTGDDVVTGNVANGGFPIDPGEKEFIPCTDPSRLYVIAGAVSHHLKLLID